MSQIRLGLEVNGVFEDAKDFIAKSSPVSQGFDLVIDATADVGVRTAIEALRTKDRDGWPGIISVLIGHDAERGVMTFSPAGASGGPVDVLRKFALHSLSRTSLSDVAADFFPASPRGDLFFPEPGCSSPTFIGSHADVTALAAMLLNEGTRAAVANSGMTAASVRRSSRQLPAVESHTWPSDTIQIDANGTGYEVRITTEALNEMRTEARRGRRIRGDKVETGGMLLGAFDEATQVLNVDRVVGPPPDSQLSQLFFQHGTVGTQEIVDESRALTGNRQGFVGLWHTHPFGAASPSPTDDEGMWELVNLHDIGRRALMLIIGGNSWKSWLDSNAQPSIYARISAFGRRSGRVSSGVPTFVMDPNAFPGGYAYPTAFHRLTGDTRRAAGDA